MLNPKISIVIPCYNTFSFIEETIDSVIIQDYPNMEIIVRDDVSTDGTWELLLSISQKMPIKIYRNPFNLGMCGNWNQLLKDASGDFILKLDADDVLTKGFLKKAINVFDECTETDAVAFPFDILDNSTKKTESLQIHRELKEGLQKDLFGTIFFKNPFALCFTIFKRAAIKPLTNGDYFLKTEIGDLDFLLRFAKNNLNLYYINQLGGYYRHHDSNSSKQPLKQAKSWINDIFPLYQSYLKVHFFNDTKKLLLERLFNYLKNCIYRRQKIDFDYLKVSLFTYLKF
jgi:glycosyltransferase involved in cell wall biosynthesis